MVSANTIDISEFQDPTVFDYQAAKSAGVKTIIIRGSVGMRLDKYAKQHIANAKRYGFNWHLYHYYYGGNGEADFAVQAAQELGLGSDQYLFLDMEDSSLPANWSSLFETFRQKAQAHFKAGLYCSDSPYKAKFKDAVLQQEHVARWVGSYSYEPQNYDIWQMSGAGSGGFGSYHHDVDRDYDKTGMLVSGSSSSDSGGPKTPTQPSEPGYRAIVLEYGFDTEAGVFGRGYSPDNGKTFHVTDTSFGRKFRQEDADRLSPYLKKYFGSWDSITNKPDVALKSDIPTSMSWSQITDKPNTNQVKTMDSGYDLSNYGDGRYEINYDAGDAPATGIHGILTVDKGKYWAKQTFTNVVENDDNHIGDTYVRMLADGKWSGWRQVTAWN